MTDHIEEQNVETIIKKISDQTKVDSSKVNWLTENDKNDIYQEIQKMMRSA